MCHQGDFGQMPIPDLNEHGLLPPGLHDCTFSQLREKFGQDQWMSGEPESAREVLCQQRSRLCGRLAAYLEELRRIGLGVVVLVDGSFVTAKPDPNDIDLVIVLPAGHDFTRELLPREYNLLSKKRAQANGFPFDIIVVGEGSPLYERRVEFFCRVKNCPELTKGLLRVTP
jgi:predicted nucleotidyltransferase